MTLHAPHPAQDIRPQTEALLTALRALGLEAMQPAVDSLLVDVGDHSILLELGRPEGLQRPPSGGALIVRAHMPLDIYVEADALSDSLMGLNLMSQTLDFGMLLLEPAPEEDADPADLDLSEATFAIVGRTVLWLAGTHAAEAQRLSAHLHRFEAEVTTQHDEHDKNYCSVRF